MARRRQHRRSRRSTRSLAGSPAGSASDPLTGTFPARECIAADQRCHPPHGAASCHKQDSSQSVSGQIGYTRRNRLIVRRDCRNLGVCQLRPAEQVNLASRSHNSLVLIPLHSWPAAGSYLSRLLSIITTTATTASASIPPPMTIPVPFFSGTDARKVYLGRRVAGIPGAAGLAGKQIWSCR